MMVVDTVQPMVLDMPAKSAEAAANIHPRNHQTYKDTK